MVQAALNGVLMELFSGVMLLCAWCGQGRVESWVKDFDLSVADQRTLYLASADLLRSSRVRTTLPSPAAAAGVPGGTGAMQTSGVLCCALARTGTKCSAWCPAVGHVQRRATSSTL